MYIPVVTAPKRRKMSDLNVIDVVDLTKSYPDLTAVDRISFTVQRGQVGLSLYVELGDMDFIGCEVVTQEDHACPGIGSVGAVRIQGQQGREVIERLPGLTRVPFRVVDWQEAIEEAGNDEEGKYYDDEHRKRGESNSGVVYLEELVVQRGIERSKNFVQRFRHNYTTSYSGTKLGLLSVKSVNQV